MGDESGKSSAGFTDLQRSKGARYMNSSETLNYISTMTTLCATEHSLYGAAKK
jgi:hypothetical protein